MTFSQFLERASTRDVLYMLVAARNGVGIRKDCAKELLRRLSRARIFRAFCKSALVFTVVFAVSVMAEAKEVEAVPEGSWVFAEDFVREIERLGYDTGCVVFFEPDEYDNLAVEDRENQNALYVEVMYGEKQNAEGDGVILNTSEDFYNYIAYSEFVPEGIPIVSFELYNPDTGFFDDIIERYDYWEFAGNSHLLRHW